MLFIIIQKGSIPCISFLKVIQYTLSSTYTVYCIQYILYTLLYIVYMFTCTYSVKQHTYYNTNTYLQYQHGQHGDRGVLVARAVGEEWRTDSVNAAMGMLVPDRVFISPGATWSLATVQRNGASGRVGQLVQRPAKEEVVCEHALVWTKWKPNHHRIALGRTEWLGAVTMAYLATRHLQVSNSELDSSGRYYRFLVQKYHKF